MVKRGARLYVGAVTVAIEMVAIEMVAIEMVAIELRLRCTFVPVMEQLYTGIGLAPSPQADS
jgi:hypothetical protein